MAFNTDISIKNIRKSSLLNEGPSEPISNISLPSSKKKKVKEIMSRNNAIFGTYTDKRQKYWKILEIIGIFFPFGHWKIFLTQLIQYVKFIHRSPDKIAIKI